MDNKVIDRDKIVLAIGGSSGSIYAKRLLDKLNTQNIEIAVTISKNGWINFEQEVEGFNPEVYENVKMYEPNDFFAPFASGSSSFNKMIVCPCSMGLLGRIATGVSNDLITRAADVMLKERRKLVIVPRETPLNLIHIRNMETLTLAGAIICPATPSFYHQPSTIEQLVDTVVDRVLDLCGLSDKNTKRWQEG
jgi:4-hydroxy-3-polyprenylbenzoate decarboxylase